MGYTASKVIGIALAEVGYLEKKSNAQLDDKTANAGSKNYTKYARDLHKAGYYNGNKQGVAYCDVGHDWVHYMAAGEDKELAEYVTCQSGDLGAGCTYSMRYYKAAGRFYKKDPKIGDQIFFGSGNSSTHTGIVIKVDGARVYTVEFNTSGDAGEVANGGGVFPKSYPLNYSRIIGYGRPRYDEEPAEEPTAEPTVKTFSVKLTVLKKGSKGQQAQALQQLLIANGCDCGVWGADGNFGAQTERALKEYQENNGLTVDGMAGPEVFCSLLGAA